MARLIYAMLTSLDGYTEDGRGHFGWSAPDEEVHAYVNDLALSIGTYLYGRKMYETMAYWETAHTLPDLSPVALEWALRWQAAHKIVYSKTLVLPNRDRTQVQRTFDPDAIRRLKAEAGADIAVAGPQLAAVALRAGLVDEIQRIVNPVVVGGGTRFLPDGVSLDLALTEARRFRNGVVALRYAVRP